jgi:hypothetical protein
VFLVACSAPTLLATTARCVCIFVFICDYEKDNLNIE